VCYSFSGNEENCMNIKLIAINDEELEDATRMEEQRYLFSLMEDSSKEYT